MGTKLNIRPLTLTVGAEIEGVDLKQPLAPETAKEIWAALLAWKVVFFRDQHLNHEQQIAMGRAFGELTVANQAYGPTSDYPEIFPVTKEANEDRYNQDRLTTPWAEWHSDLMPAVNPPAASILRGEIIPQAGGDTHWTNLAAAYQALSPKMQELICDLHTVNKFPVRPDARDDVRKNAQMASEHPLVRVHPETGERILYLSPVYVQHIVELTRRESQLLLQCLLEHIVRPEFTVRFKWNQGDVGFWDNRATAHLAPSDIYSVEDERLMYRVTLMGDVPIGVDGKPSRSITGQAVSSPKAA